MAARLDIVIVNWNSNDLLRKCLKSIEGSTFQNINIVIVDNGSNDNSLSCVESSRLQLTLVSNDTNRGFAAACNQGIGKSNSELVLFLNPDTELIPDTLAKGIEILRINEDIWILGCQQLDSIGNVLPSCTRFPRLHNYLFDIFGLSKINPKKFRPATIMLDWDHTDSRFVDQVMGSFMLMRRNIFDIIGYFDERFFVYYEDLDFAYRVSQAGGKCYYTTELQIHHVGGGASKNVLAMRLYYSLKSRIRYSFKHFSKISAVTLLLFTISLEPISRFVFAMIKREFHDLKNIFKAYTSIYKDIVIRRLLQDL